MRWSTVQLLQAADDERGLTARARWAANERIISSPDHPDPWCWGCSGRTTGRFMGSVTAPTAGAGTRRHHALFEGGESATPGTAAAGVLHAPGAIGFGAARAGIDNGGQRANGEQDHSGAHGLHGEFFGCRPLQLHPPVLIQNNVFAHNPARGGLAACAAGDGPRLSDGERAFLSSRDGRRGRDIQRVRARDVRPLFLHGPRHRRNVVFDEERIEHHQRQ